MSNKTQPTIEDKIQHLEDVIKQRDDLIAKVNSYSMGLEDKLGKVNKLFKEEQSEKEEVLKKMTSIIEEKEKLKVKVKEYEARAREAEERFVAGRGYLGFVRDIITIFRKK